MKTLFTILLLLAFSTNCLGQDDLPFDPAVIATIDLSKGNAFTLKTNQDGSTSFVPIGESSDDPQTARVIASQKLALQLANQSSGISTLLRQFSVEKFNALSRVELSDEQKAEIKKIATEYNEGIGEFPRNSLPANRFKIKHAKRIHEVLLPDQIKALHSYRLPRGGVFNIIRDDDISKYLELTDKQIKELEADCKKANDELEVLIQKQNEALEAKRKQVKEIYSRLANEQQEKINSLLGGDISKSFGNASLKSLRDVTKLK